MKNLLSFSIFYPNLMQNVSHLCLVSPPLLGGEVGGISQINLRIGYNNALDTPSHCNLRGSQPAVLLGVCHCGFGTAQDSGGFTHECAGRS